MAGSAPKEIQGIPTRESGNIVEFVPRQEKEWREGVVQHAQKIEPSFTTEKATPPAQSIKNSEPLRKVQAEIVDEEPTISGADIKHLIDTAPADVFGEDPDTYNRGISGSKVKSFMEEKARKLFHMRKQQTKKAA